MQPDHSSQHLEDFGALSGVAVKSSAVVDGREPIVVVGSPITQDRALDSQPALSIILPTRNEVENIDTLIECLESALRETSVEVIFVDDSDDGTVAAIESAKQRSHLAITLLHRAPEHRSGGLGGAVVAGFRLARAPWACVMDADLQHPPDLIPKLFDQAHRTGADLVVASRYVEQGNSDGLNRIRKVVSQSLSAAARLAFPGVLAKVSDPLSGFFMVRTRAIDLDELRPNGFKILFEIVARHPRLAVAEVGFKFGKRYAGESKASIREGLRYVSQLARLRLGERPMRLARFAAVGISGILVNLLILIAITELWGVHYLLSAIIATQGSTLWNFVLSDRWVFAGRQTQPGTTRLIQFLAMNNVALLARGPMIYALTAGLLVHYTLSTLISLVVLALIRYELSDRWIWGGERKMRVHAQFGYDIHGVITISSEVRLPELEAFMTAERVDDPTIDVRIGRNTRQWLESRDHDPEATPFRYSEGFGALGFRVDIELSSKVRILASPILRWSPHVLYTNVVEPILRWSLAARGYALVHGACLAYDDQAYLITARTDTGKTTTLLRILNHQRRASDKGAFLSDDLTLVSADKRVFTYPKPLTISSHTVAAIDTPLLSWRERIALIVQSRLHSRDGRRLALLLANTRLPMATINTIVQLLVPPPKFPVQRLVPRVKTVRESTLAGIFVIERGEDDELALQNETAYETLMSNSEDAYGFPPYQSIATFLHGAHEQDLVGTEREIVANALDGLPSFLIRSSQMDWAERITAFVAPSTARSPRAVAPVPDLVFGVGD